MADIYINILGDATKLKSALGEANKGITAFGEKIGKIGRTMTIAGTAVTAISIGLIKMASDAEETSSKFGTVFRDVSKEAEETAKNLAENFGLSSKSAKQLLGDTGDLLTGFGFTGGAALDLATQVNELAVDLASFTNYSGGAEGASAALTKALLGERESVKSLGISILEVDVKNKMLEMSKQGLRFETERQAKAYATLLIAQEQSKNAIGDFSRTSGGFANQIRILKARISDVVVELGEKLLPIATKLIGKVIEVVKNINKWIEAHPKLVEWIVKIGATIGALAAVGGPILMAVSALMKMKGAMIIVQKFMANPFNAAILLVAANIIIWKQVIEEIDKILKSHHTTIEDVNKAHETHGKALEMVAEKLGIGVIELQNFQKSGASVSEMMGIELKPATEEVTKTFEDFLAEVNRMAGIGDILQPAEKAIKKIVDAFTPYEKKLQAINDRYDKAKEKIKEYIKDEEELKVAIEKLNEGRKAEITLLDRQKTALEKVAEAKKRLADLTKSLTDKIYEFTHTEEEVKLRDINREYDSLIENAREVLEGQKELAKAIGIINGKRQEEIDALKESNELKKEATEDNKDLKESYEDLGKKIDEAGEAGKKAGEEIADSFVVVSRNIHYASASLNSFTKEAVAAAITQIKMSYMPKIELLMKQMTELFFPSGWYEYQIGNLTRMMDEAIAKIMYGYKEYQRILTSLEASGGASSFVIPSYKTGTPSVPRTGLAVVHVGEEINPPGRRSYDQRKYSNVVNIYNPIVRSDDDINKIERSVKDILDRDSQERLRQGNEIILGT